jgi:lipid A 3-O-deacylase
MKHFVRVPFILLLMFVAFPIPNACAVSLDSPKHPGVYLNEISIASGYGWAPLKRDGADLAVYPLFVRFGFNSNSFFGVETGQSTLQIALEPFVNFLSRPASGVETGCSIGLRYLHELSNPLNIFMEGSVAPMFLSINSAEQGKAGFNFLNQIGVGLQYKVTGGTALFTAYRFRHLSNGGLVGGPNMGINSNAIVAGVSWLY